jgi:hypothetical protein
VDRETAERLAVVETELSRIKEESSEWKGFIRDIIKKVILWLLAVGTSGILFGWHVPQNVRKAVIDWVSE